MAAKPLNLSDFMYPEGNTPKPVPSPKAVLKPSGTFVKDFVPPDYLIDGWLQRRFLYSLTGKTGHGKTSITLYIAACVAKGKRLFGMDVMKARVLYLAGENPDDIRMRWIKLCEDMGLDPDKVDVTFIDARAKLSDPITRKTIEEGGPYGLMIVDTSTAFFEGKEENDGIQAQAHAAMLRTYTTIAGGPTVIVNCHPNKTPNMEELLPRGAGPFLNEVDGNLVCIKSAETLTIEVTWHGKFRGPDFPSVYFKLVPGQSEKIVDSKGRQI